MTRQQTNGAIFFLLDSAAFMEKGKKKEQDRGRGEEQATAMGVPCAARTSKE